jgi:hypothetical protein
VSLGEATKLIPLDLQQMVVAGYRRLTAGELSALLYVPFRSLNTGVVRPMLEGVKKKYKYQGADE